MAGVLFLVFVFLLLSTIPGTRILGEWKLDGGNDVYVFSSYGLGKHYHKITEENLWIEESFKYEFNQAPGLFDARLDASGAPELRLVDGDLTLDFGNYEREFQTNFWFDKLYVCDMSGIILKSEGDSDKPVTKAEMAAIVCDILGREADGESKRGKTLYDDVSAAHWASGYINIASEEGIIHGDNTDKFRPDDNIKYEEAIKMVICALGYDDGITAESEDWSAAYLKIADEKGISANLKGTKGTPATRGDIDTMLNNNVTADPTTDSEEKADVVTPKDKLYISENTFDPGFRIIAAIVVLILIGYFLSDDYIIFKKELEEKKKDKKAKKALEV